MAVFSSTLFAQGNAPVKQWKWTGPSTPIYGEKDWLHFIIQTSDGGYLAGRYAMRNTVKIAALLKLSAAGQKEWDRVYDFGNSNIAGGTYDAVEVEDGYMVVGNRANPSDMSVLLFKVDKRDGTLKSGPQYFGETNLEALQAELVGLYK